MICIDIHYRAMTSMPCHDQSCPDIEMDIDPDAEWPNLRSARNLRLAVAAIGIH